MMKYKFDNDMYYSLRDFLVHRDKFSEKDFVFCMSSISYNMASELIDFEEGDLNLIGNSSQDIVINRHTWNTGSSSRLSGYIDELRISNIARYTNEFEVPSYEFVSDQNTMGLWHFNGDLNDVSGNENHATAEGSELSKKVGKLKAKQGIDVSVRVLDRKRGNEHVTIFAKRGEEKEGVKSLISNSYYTSGYHNITWDGKNNMGIQVPSGLYFYKLVSDHQILTKKMVMMK